MGVIGSAGEEEPPDGKMSGTMFSKKPAAIRPDVPIPIILMSKSLLEILLLSEPPVNNRLSDSFDDNSVLAPMSATPFLAMSSSASMLS